MMTWTLIVLAFYVCGCMVKCEGKEEMVNVMGRIRNMKPESYDDRHFLKSIQSNELYPSNTYREEEDKHYRVSSNKPEIYKRTNICPFINRIGLPFRICKFRKNTRRSEHTPNSKSPRSHTTTVIRSELVDYPLFHMLGGGLGKK